MDENSSLTYTGDEEIKDRPDNLIRSVFSDAQLKALYYLAMRIDIEDNNDKAEMIKMIVPPEFEELGTGTNRIAFLYNNLVYKIALDRRGLVDNNMEMRRSEELPMYLAKTYESNYLINVAEYVMVVDRDTFVTNEDSIKHILADMANDYLFDDIGYSLKNYCNWGSRFSTTGEEMVILDYGYLYPLFGQNRTELFRCPKCGGKLTWNPNFTELVCNGGTSSNDRCNARFSPMAIRRNMTLDFENLEEKLNSEFNQLQRPNLNKIEESISKIGDA